MLSHLTLTAHIGDFSKTSTESFLVCISVWRQSPLTAMDGVEKPLLKVFLGDTLKFFPTFITSGQDRSSYAAIQGITRLCLLQHTPKLQWEAHRFEQYFLGFCGWMLDLLWDKTFNLLYLSFVGIIFSCRSVWVLVEPAGISQVEQLRITQARRCQMCSTES